MIDYQQVEATVRDLKRQVKAGQLDQKTFESKLKALIDVGGDGYYWMFGHKTEQWYRHNGTTWVPDHPDQPANPHAHSTHQPPEITWGSVDVGWFFVSLVLLGIIAGIVYSASL